MRKRVFIEFLIIMVFTVIGLCLEIEQDTPVNFIVLVMFALYGSIMYEISIINKKIDKK